MNKAITAHSIVKNESRYVWFAIQSVIEYVDRVLLWDTGSTDSTKEILKELKEANPSKIDLKFIDEIDAASFTTIRQQMLDETKTDWFMIVDGDEVWWDQSIKGVVEAINTHDNLETIVSPYYNIVGDIFHYQPEIAGKYRIDSHKGHINIRAINRKIPGLHFSKPHGLQGLFDNNEILIQNRQPEKRLFLELPYLHFTNVIRSLTRAADMQVVKRAAKQKFELGIPFPRDFFYPEVFFYHRPEMVPSPWEKRNRQYLLKAIPQTPLRSIKRHFFPDRIGY